MIKKTLSFSSKTHLSLRLGQLVIHKKNDQGIDEEYTRPIEDIGVVIIESGMVTLSAALIAALTENNVAVIFCDSRHMPSGMMMPLSGNCEQSERYNAQISASLPLKKQLWQQTVMAKIRNQAAILSCVCQIHVGNMLAWSEKVRSGDADNLEARAAVYYWRNLLSAYPDFKRDQFGDYPNALFNYGYSILRSVMARCLVGSGLLPTFGIFHKNKYNAFCLADDIMEPYRPYVDLLAVKYLNEHPNVSELSKDAKHLMLTLPTMDVRMKNVRRPLLIAASMTTASLAKCFLGEIRKIEYPEIEM